MKTVKTVMITSAGVATAINVISALRRSTRYDFRIIAVDVDKYAAGLHLADYSYLVPTIKDPCYIKKLLLLVAQHGVDFIFPLYSKEISLFAVEMEMFRAAGVQLFIPSSEIVDLCDEKPQFLDFLSLNNFDYPKTYTTPGEVREFPVFIKPVRGSSSANTFKINNSGELFYYTEQNIDFIIQEYVADPEYTVDCLVDRDHRIIAAMPRERIKVKDGKSVVARSVRNEVIEREVSRLLTTLELTGPCNVQLFFDGQRLRFVEVNPRLAAGGLPLAVEAGVNIPELMVRLAEGERLDYQDFEDGVIMMRYLSDLFVRNESIAKI